VYANGNWREIGRILPIVDRFVRSAGWVSTVMWHFLKLCEQAKEVYPVFRTADFSKVATIKVGKLPHGIWPSGDGTRVYVGLENGDQLVAIDTLSNSVVASVPIGQAAQAIVYVPGAAPLVGNGANQAMTDMSDLPDHLAAESKGSGMLQPLGLAGQTSHFTLRTASGKAASADPPTNVTLFDQGLIQVLEASVTGLEPKRAYVLALAAGKDGSGALEPLTNFMTNPAGAAIVNALGPIRQVVQGEVELPRRYLVIVPGPLTGQSKPVQIQE
jgi:YVTN family beta-propeller protein